MAQGVEDPETNSPDVSTEQDGVSEAQESTVNETAESSPADEGERSFDLLSVVRDATRGEEEESDDAASPADEESGDATEEGASEEAESKAQPDDEDFSDVPFNKHPRFKQLIEQRNEARKGAQQFEQVQTFLNEQGINAEEAADALQLRALMKHNPTEAWKKLKPIAQELLVQAGEVLPDDLKQRVQKGELSRDAALEVSRHRAQTGSMERQRSYEQQLAQQREHEGRVAGVRNSVASWEQQTRDRDADFDRKVEPLQREIAWIHRQEGMPTTPEAAREQLQRAYDAVNKRVSEARPRKPEKRPVTGGRAAGGNQAPAPKSILDVVQANREAG